ncbi:GNAT family N-acetyltransferase [Glutamicibacter halophytocola]|uniref:GNAT family N-acetyltransferase n=1 Tax=Glutamicibacter halophytocola TaxID=1933880 RepID=A0AA94XTZ7_9MICC|nr:GNAT family N-acetyltransferase [Glutamicibacter halophytocola]UUX59880.1 GNAT family N-acetyltransferase [Glutamicibacter halophytocola]
MSEFDLLSQEMDVASFEELEPKLRARDDAFYQRWCEALSTLSDAPASIREAVPTPADARRMRDMQLVCEPITPLGIRRNATTLSEDRVFIAEIERVPVGFALAAISEKHAPLFMQVVAVVPQAQQRGIGLQLLRAATETEPDRNIALATQSTNFAAHAMNRRFAASIGASIQRVNLGVYPDSYLGISRGQGYRAWEIRRR